ncbi:MAG: SurA N-terminal domain-containing protein [Prevotella sp.]|nr:SurA N-terminal domain-containing protein [Prevotella sp.]
MAAIGKIRSWGPALVAVIGLALFAFIAEELFRSCDATKNEQRQQVGQVLGKKISVQEFQTLVDEYQEVMKITRGVDNLSEDELNNVKDQVWGTFVQNTLIEDECAKLGLTVTDEELQNVLKEGTNPMLRQTPFINQQTRLFDVTMLTKFLNDYKTANAQEREAAEPLYKYWKFIEKNLRSDLLAMKYRNLLAGCMLSNPVSAQAAFNDQNMESSIVLASLAYSSVNDNDVQVDDAELKARYNEEREQHKEYVENRDIKYALLRVQPSEGDRAALMATMKEAQKGLQEGAAAADVVRKAQSQIAYTGMSVTRAALPNDIAAKVDTMAVGQTSAPFETASDNTMNVVKLISKTQMPDSIEYRAIRIGGATIDAARATADSVYQAIKGGAVFDSIAKKYGETGEAQWLTSAMYQNAPMLDADTKAYLTALNTTAVGELKNLELSQGNIIILVKNRKAMVDKYDVAIVKHSIDFSKQTYSDAYNKFSQFVSSSKTIEAMEKNAPEYGLQVLTREHIVSSAHNVVGIRSTRETMKWIFDAKPNEISPLYECGNNDCLLVVALTKINKVGYQDMESLKDELKREVLRDKKFELLSKKLEGVKNIAEAQQQGARIDTVPMITFSAPVFVQATSVSEPVLSGAVASTKEGEFSKKVVKGNEGAYVFQVVQQKMREGVTFNAKTQEQQLKQQALQAAGNFMQELYQNAKVVDNRYLFF